MEKINWLRNTDDKELQQAARKKIEALQAFENEAPAIYIVHNLQDQSVVYMSERGLKVLRVTLDQIRLPHADYHQQFFNPEDAAIYVPKILVLVERNKPDEWVTFFQQVRPSANEEWVWYLSSTKIFLLDKQNKPLLLLTMTAPIDSKHHITTKVERLQQELNFLHHYQHVFAELTRREKEILKLMALGKNSQEIADDLHISETTANTHRRNIRKKINAQTPYEVTRFAQAFDLI